GGAGAREPAQRGLRTPRRARAVPLRLAAQFARARARGRGPPRARAPRGDRCGAPEAAPAPRHPPPPPPPPPPRPRAARRPRASATDGLTPDERRLREELVALLGEHRGNVTAVASAMGKGRMQIHRWCKRLAIDHATFRR